MARRTKDNTVKMYSLLVHSKTKKAMMEQIMNSTINIPPWHKTPFNALGIQCNDVIMVAAFKHCCVMTAKGNLLFNPTPFLLLSVWCFLSFSKYFHLYREFIVTGDELQKTYVQRLRQLFTVQHLLRHWTSVFKDISEGPVIVTPFAERLAVLLLLSI